MDKNLCMEQNAIVTKEIKKSLSHLIGKGIYIFKCYHKWDKQISSIENKILIRDLMKWKLWECRKLLEAALSIDENIMVMKYDERLTNQPKMLIALEYNYSEQLLLLTDMQKEHKVRVDMMLINTIQSNILAKLNTLTNLVGDNGQTDNK